MDLTPEISRKQQGPFIGDFRTNMATWQTEVYVGDGRWVAVLDELCSLRQEEKRWKDIAIHLLDIHAATGWDLGLKSKTSKGERLRYISILESGISYLKGLTKPYMGPGYGEKTPEERVIERSQGAIEEMRKKL
jgi:hypothetical protein